MEAIQQTIQELSALFIEVPRKLHIYSEEEFSFKPGNRKWSKKEILGHLCDSCFNNIQRLIRVQYEDKPFIIYNQDEWVKAQHYQHMHKEEVIELWTTLHKQFIHILKHFPPEKVLAIIDTGSEVSAEFVITDYPEHQRHHLSKIFGS